MSMVATESGEDKDRKLEEKEETQLQECVIRRQIWMGDLISKNGGSNMHIKPFAGYSLHLEPF